MKILISLFSLSLASIACAQTVPLDPISLANPLVGPDPYRGATAAGAARPHSLVRLGPDTTRPSTSGYNSKEPILGFSHTHLSGAGGVGYYGNIRLTPQSGALDVVNLASPKADESNQPGLYRVRLTRDNIGVELTSTERAGVHRYTFPTGATPRVLIDLAAVVNTNRPTSAPSSICTGAKASFVSPTRIEGQASFESDFGKFPHTVFFSLEFNRPVTGRATWLENEVREGVEAVESTRGQRIGLVATFAPGAPVEARVGISFRNLDLARQNLAPTLGQSFDTLTNQAQGVWRAALGKIEISGGTDTQRRQFYSALYHTTMMPTDITGDHELWKSDEPLFDDVHAVWDTFRCTYPLFTLTQPVTMRRILRSQLDIYKNRGWMPDYFRGRGFNIIQGGTNMDVVIADALVKNLGGFNTALAYEAVKKNATAPTPGTGYWSLSGRHAPYFTFGFLPSVEGAKQKTMSPVSVSLEYAYNDFAVAQAARAVGNEADAQKFLAQSGNTWKLFNPDSKFFQAKTAEGAWLPGFDPAKYAGNEGQFYEGTAWSYRFFAPHDMAGMIERQGGATAFVAALDEYFDKGFHNAGNEPSFLTPWLYNYAGRPDKSADRVYSLLTKDYLLAPAAYRGDDDSGSMSAWYVFNAMGFYPVAGQDVYLLGSPLFASSRLKLENGRTFSISARNQSPENRYVQSATLNGRVWNQAWLRHSDIMGGANLVLEMGPKPSKWGATNLPPSRQLAAAPVGVKVAVRPN